MNTPTAARAAIHWSAGQDCCLAWLRAREQGLRIDTFVTVCRPMGFSLSHALPRPWLARQVASCGADFWPVDVIAGGYESAFRATLATLRKRGHTHMVFGDVDLAARRSWIAPRCEDAGIEAMFPLWGERRRALAQEVLERGIRSRLVAVNPARLDKGFCGSDYDVGLLARLPADVCPFGQDGEFYAAVTYAPGMAHPVPLMDRGVRLVASAPPLAPSQIAQLMLADR